MAESQDMYTLLQVVQGDQSGKEPPLAAASADVWALGVITFEIMSGKQACSTDWN